MTARTLLLSLHIVGVAAWLGANLTQLFLVRYFAKQTNEARRSWVGATTLMGATYYNAAGVVIGVTGVLLVQDGGWSWSSGFIWVGVATLVIGAVLGLTVFIPSGASLRTAIDAGDTTTIARLDRRVLTTAVIDTSVVVIAILAMVHKWSP